MKQTFEFNDRFEARHHKKMPSGMIPISMNGITQKKFKELLIFTWTLSPKKVKEAFKPIFKREIFTDDFPLIINHNKLKMDKVLYGVDFRKILQYIPYQDNDLGNISKMIFIKRDN